MNFILIILDSLRADHVGCYGNTWIKTPNMDALAKESVVLTRGFPESLPTLPVRRAIHTGMRTFPFRNYNPKKGDVVRLPGWEPIPEEQVTLSEVLHDAGYRTAFITDAYHQFKPSMNYHRGFDQWEWIRGQERDMYRSAPVPRGIDMEKHLTPEMRGKGPHDILVKYFANTAERRSEEDWFAPQVFRAGMRWLHENRDAEKFFLCVDSFDPHEPWDPPREYAEMYFPGYKGREIITPLYYGDSSYLSHDELRYMRALYAGEVTMVDKWLGLFLDKVRELGLMDDTLIVLISDHGHPLGDHGAIGKLPWALYPELLDIPYMIRHPKGECAGKRVDDFVYNHDIMATALDLLGIRPPEGIDSRNIWPLVKGEGGPRREYITSAFKDYALCRDERYEYIVRFDGEEPELFDLIDDPKQTRNLVKDKPKVAREMWDRILADAGGELPTYEGQRSSRAGEWYRA
ncbi:MAG: sulfatase [bacterium]